MEMQFPEHYLYKDEHYDPTASWLDEIYCEEDEDDGDVTMEEDNDDIRATIHHDENDDEEDEDEDEENRPPRQWRSRRHQKSRLKQPQMMLLQQHLRAPLQELPLDEDEDDEEHGGFPRKKKNTTRRGSFRLMRSLSPPAASNRNAPVKSWSMIPPLIHRRSLLYTLSSSLFCSLHLYPISHLFDKWQRICIQYDSVPSYNMFVLCKLVLSQMLMDVW